MASVSKCGSLCLCGRSPSRNVADASWFFPRVPTCGSAEADIDALRSVPSSFAMIDRRAEIDRN
jgi:hypothetical protein